MTIDDFNRIPLKDYFVVDIRDEISYMHGHVPAALNYSVREFDNDRDNVMEGLEKFVREHNPGRKPVIVCCKAGLASEEVSEALNEDGFESFSLDGGYQAWLLDSIKNPVKSEPDEEPSHVQVEKSIRKKFHKNIWCKFTKAINEYELVKPGDRIAVCISGGKDSMLMAKLFQELKRHNKFDFELVFLVMDPGYTPVNRKAIEDNARHMNVPITVFESDIFNSVFNIEKSPCYLCARMRRGYLYSNAKKLGCNKIALGHHYDDVIETVLMGMLYGGQVQTMMPKLHSTNFDGMELIRPLYLVREADIEHWRDYNGLTFLRCACRFTEQNKEVKATGDSASKRLEIKHLIAQLSKINPQVEQNIFKSVENVNLSTVIAYKDKEGKKHNFLDEY